LTMAAYRFPLETLLKHRLFIEERLQRELAECRRELLAEEARLNDWRRQQETQARRFFESATVGMHPSEAIQHHRFMTRLATSEADQLRQVAEVRRKLSVKRSDLLEAVKQRKTLEKLKSKQARAHRDAQHKTEQAFISEMAITRYNRRS